MASKRPAPFSVRMTAEVRARLECLAGDMALGAYLIACGLNAEIAKRVRGVPKKSVAQMLAQILALLGGVATVLRGLAKGARDGTLDFSPETETAIRNACKDITVMKALLMRALNLKEH